MENILSYNQRAQHMFYQDDKGMEATINLKIF